jgi:ribonucleoside-diphosphate reductase subunit M2
MTPDTLSIPNTKLDCSSPDQSPPSIQRSIGTTNETKADHPFAGGYEGVVVEAVSTADILPDELSSIQEGEHPHPAIATNDDRTAKARIYNIKEQVRMIFAGQLIPGGMRLPPSKASEEWISLPQSDDGECEDESDDFEELLFKRSEDRFSPFPIRFHDIWSFCKLQQGHTWFAHEIDYMHDLQQWSTVVTPAVKFVVTMVLSFFLASDGIVNENIGTNFGSEIHIAEVRSYYSTQSYFETIHGETYGEALETLVSPQVRMLVNDAIHTIPPIAAKKEWMFKYMDKSVPLENRIFSFILVEGLFFSSSFCVLFWLKKNSLLPGLTYSNELISVDEGIHTRFGMLMYSKLKKRRLEESVVHAIVKEAVAIETKFVEYILDIPLPGLTDEAMIQYVRYVADYLLINTGYAPIYGEKNPFDWMTPISLDGKTNMFEKKIAEYATGRNRKYIYTGNNELSKWINDLDF